MKEIPLTRGAVALVDDEDYESLARWSWHLAVAGYAARRQSANPGRIGRPKAGEKREAGKSRIVLMHRAIVGAPDGTQVHHRNGDRLDNRRENLEILRPIDHHRGHSARGAASQTRERNWAAEAHVSGQKFYLGRFPTEAQARAVAAAFQRGADVGLEMGRSGR